MQRGDMTTQDAGPNPNAGHHSPPPFNKATKQTTRGVNTNVRGTPHHRREGQYHSTRPSTPCHPTSPCHPTIHDAPTHHQCEGGTDRGYPTTQTPQRHTHPHTPHTQQRTVRNIAAALTSIALGVDGIGHTHWSRRTSSSTHHRHSTAAHGQETDTIHSSTLTLFTFT